MSKKIEDSLEILKKQEPSLSDQELSIDKALRKIENEYFNLARELFDKYGSKDGFKLLLGNIEKLNIRPNQEINDIYFHLAAILDRISNQD